MFNYAVLNRDESELLGCIDIDPPGDRTIASWWVVDCEIGGDLERCLNTFVSRCPTEQWGSRAVHYARDAARSGAPGKSVIPGAHTRRCRSGPKLFAWARQRLLFGPAADLCGRRALPAAFIGGD
jgi:hypothetical protein